MENALRECCQGIKIGKILVNRSVRGVGEGMMGKQSICGYHECYNVRGQLSAWLLSLYSQAVRGRE